MPDNGNPLGGVGVLVTRPEHQARKLCENIRQLGGNPVLLPVLDILPSDHPTALAAVIEQLERYDIAIFISANAVSFGLDEVNRITFWPQQLATAAVGKSTARALSARGITPDIFPQHVFNSEALLELPQMQDVAGKKIVIFRGHGGRELLADSLKARGAEVDYAECYRRALPEISDEQLSETWKDHDIHIVTVTSNEGLNNLVELLHTQREQLLRKPVVVVSERGADLARQLGFSNDILVANEASDDGMIETLIAWHKRTT